MEAGDGEGRDAATERENGRVEGREGRRDWLVGREGGGRKAWICLLREIFICALFAEKPPRGRIVAFFLFLYFLKKIFFTEIYFLFHNLQFYIPTVRLSPPLPGGRDLYVIKI